MVDCAQEEGRRSDFFSAQCVELEEFLVRDELEKLTAFALAQQNQFRQSTVTTPESDQGLVDYRQRRSRVLYELGTHRLLFLARLRAAFPIMIERLSLSSFHVRNVETQLTATGDGEFFGPHNDTGPMSSREVTFVYYFRTEPKAYFGGELRLYDTQVENGRCCRLERFITLSPQQNQLVAFSASVIHEILPVSCPSRRFECSRFTLNGWFHR